MYLLLNSDRKLFDLVLAMDLGFGSLLLQERFFFFMVDIGYSDRVELASLPVGLGCLSPEHVFVDLDFLLVVLEVAVSDHVVVSLTCLQNSLASSPLHRVHSG